MPGKKVVVIGSGFAGLSSATVLADQGYEVEVIEKNDQPGGRARTFNTSGFMFDMGPSWYWMPDVFERFFNRFEKSTSNYYKLVRLDPSYQVFFGKDDVWKIPAKLDDLKVLFEQTEKGSGIMLQKFLDEAAYKYKVGINHLVYKPGRSVTEFLSVNLLFDLFRLDLFTSFHHHIRKFFKHEKLIKLMEFPILFLGATAENTPALYSLMNHADINLGTWYPMGGMHKIVEGMVTLARSKGVNFRLGEPVTGFELHNRRIIKVKTEKGMYTADAVVAGADYHFVDQELLQGHFRTYNPEYWDSRVMGSIKS